MLDGTVGLACGDCEIEIIENGQQRCQKIKLCLQPTILKRFHQTGAHFGSLFFKICLCLFKLCLHADKLCLGCLTPSRLGLEISLKSYL